MRITVMTYNILYGFHERHGDTMLFHEERARAAREVVAKETPDILGLTEATYCGLHGRMLRMDYASMFGLTHLYTAGFEGEWANCLLSKYPILHAERLTLGRAGSRSDGATEVSAIRATIDCEGRHVQIDLIHPSPKVPELERVEAVAPLLRSRSSPYILMGDFNALSDEDPYTHEALVAQMRGNVEGPDLLATKMLDRQLLAAVRAAGLRDTLPPEKSSHTIPTKLSRPGATQGAQLRIDYIFASHEFCVERSEIVKSEEADKVSDHYPLVATLTID